MSLTFPADHPFASCAALSSSSKPTEPAFPIFTGPLPPRRQHRSSPIQHTRAGSSSSNASHFIFPSSTESEADFLKRLSSTSTQFGTTSRRSSQSIPASDYESFAAEIQGAKRQFGSIGRRGGMELSERHERAADELEAEVEGAVLSSAVRLYVGRV